MVVCHVQMLPVLSCSCNLPKLPLYNRGVIRRGAHAHIYLFICTFCVGSWICAFCVGLWTRAFCVGSWNACYEPHVLCWLAERTCLLLHRSWHHLTFGQLL